MINVEKTLPGPECLEVEKKKKSGDYKCGNVLPLLKEDFCNKCYICEEKEPSTINVEHFEPHGGDKGKKFAWENLFYSCGHCNGAKGVKYNTNENNRLLDCTNPEHDIENLIKFELKSSGLEYTVVITPMDDASMVENTVKLLRDVYIGNTKTKEIEAGNIREKLSNEIIEFKKQILGYRQSADDGKKRVFKKRIDGHLSKHSAFTAFKRRLWRSVENAELKSLRGSGSGSGMGRRI